MALTERTVVDKMEVLENGIIQIRKANIIEKDGTEMTRTFHRYVLKPGDDVTTEEQRVQDVAGTVWTQEVIDAYLASLPDPDPDSP